MTVSEQKIAVALVLQVVLPIVAAIVFALSAYGAARIEIEGNTTRIDMQGKQLTRVLDKLDRIEALLLERK